MSYSVFKKCTLFPVAFKDNMDDPQEEWQQFARSYMDRTTDCPALEQLADLEVTFTFNGTDECVDKASGETSECASYELAFRLPQFDLNCFHAAGSASGSCVSSVLFEFLRRHDPFSPSSGVMNPYVIGMTCEGDAGELWVEGIKFLGQGRYVCAVALDSESDGTDEPFDADLKQTE